MSTWALVPVKPPSSGKSRLAPLLDQRERAELARQLARGVVSALRAAAGFAGVAVLAPDGAAEALAAEFGCRVFTDDPALDMNANLDRALARLAAEGAATVVIVPADLPALGPADCAALLAAHAGGGVTLVPAARDGGTNALALAPPGAIGCRFGPDSARRHLEAARAGGLRAASVAIAGFARDIDTVDDVRWFCGEPRGGEAREYLEASGICARLAQRGAGTA